MSETVREAAVRLFVGDIGYHLGLFVGGGDGGWWLLSGAG